MSKGLGRIGQAIEAAFEAEPYNAFTTEDLCDRAYPGADEITRAQRVAVLRAAKGLTVRRPDLGITCWAAETLGARSVFFRRFRVMSYAMARVKTDRFNDYRSNDPRTNWQTWRSKSEAELRAWLAEGATIIITCNRAGHGGDIPPLRLRNVTATMRWQGFNRKMLRRWPKLPRGWVL